MAKNEFAYFTETVNTLIEGKLILVDKHIASVLKCVATSPTLYRCLAETLKTMTYATEFSRAKISWTRNDGVVESRIKLPVDRNRMFAFVVCLLTEIDSGRRSFLEFLKEYYNRTDSNLAYAKFTDEVLKPFKTAGESILKVIDPQSQNAEFAEQAQRFFDAENIYIDSIVLNEIFIVMNDVRKALDELKLSDPCRIEYTTVSEYLVNALYLKNPKIIKICWIAYKNAIGGYQAVLPYLVKLSDLIGTYVF